MSFNRCNSVYVKPFTHLTRANQLQLCKNNYYVIIIQLVCNYHGNVMLTSFFINPSKYDTWHYGDFLVIFFFEISISTIHHDYAFINDINVPFAIKLQL
jgi:hypothetical protein